MQLRDHHQGALSQRRAGGRQAPAPRPAVFLRLLLAAGHAAHSGCRRASRSSDFAEQFAVQLNDTHPSIGGGRADAAAGGRTPPRLGHGLGHHRATPSATPITPCCPRRWRPGRCRCSHEFLPRHLEIIYEINPRFLAEVRARFPDDEARVARMSLIGEEGGKRVRMAHLATVGSHAVNGVAALHTELLKAQRAAGLPRALARALQQQDQRRHAAPLPGARQPGAARADRPIHRRRLADAISTNCRKLEAFADDAAFRARLARGEAGQQGSASPSYVHAHTGIELDPAWLFDIQVKRIHEYKRQHLNVLHIVTLYKRLKRQSSAAMSRRAPSSSAARPRPATSWPSASSS